MRPWFFFTSFVPAGSSLPALWGKEGTTLVLLNGSEIQVPHLALLSSWGRAPHYFSAGVGVHDRSALGPLTSPSPLSPQKNEWNMTSSQALCEPQWAAGVKHGERWAHRGRLPWAPPLPQGLWVKVSFPEIPVQSLVIPAWALPCTLYSQSFMSTVFFRNKEGSATVKFKTFLHFFFPLDLPLYFSWRMCRSISKLEDKVKETIQLKQTEKKRPENK